MTRRAPGAKHEAPCCGQRRAGYVFWWSFANGGVYECKRCGATFTQVDTTREGAGEGR
jgi:hypothetical protein